MAILARLGVVLGLDTAEFQQGLDRANKQLKQFAAQIPTIGTAAAAAFAAATYKALAYADAISDTAKANEVAVASVMALSKGLAMNGGEAENAGKMLSSFASKIDEAAQGSDAAQKTFARVGVSLKDLGSKDTTSLLDQTINALASMQDPVSRTALAVDLFGKAAKGVDFVGLAQGSADARKEFEQYAAAVEQAAELHDKLQERADRAVVTFTNLFIPTLNKLYDALTQDSSGMEKFGNIAKKVFEFVAYAAHLAYTAISIVAEAIGFVGRSLMNLLQLNFSEIGRDYFEYSKRVYELGKNNVKFAHELFDEKPSETPDKPKTKFAGRQVLPGKEAQKLDQQLALAKLISEEYRRQAEHQLDGLKLQGRMAFMSENERKIAEAIFRVEDQTSQKIAEIVKKKEEAAAHGTDKKVLDEMDRQIEKVKEIGAAYQELTRIEIESQIAAQRTFEFGWNKAFNQFSEDLGNNAKMAEEMFNTVTNSMSSAIDNFVKTGKLSFSGLAKSIIQDLIAIQLKASAMKMFSSAGDIFGFSSFAGLKSLLGFADGGDPPVNQVSLVGERGPELFIPRTAGTVIPNEKISSMVGSGKTVNNFTINAIDTKSFEDRLFNSSNAVWAANQYATKSLAVGKGRT